MIHGSGLALFIYLSISTQQNTIPINNETYMMQLGRLELVLDPLTHLIQDCRLQAMGFEPQVKSPLVFPC